MISEYDKTHVSSIMSGEGDWFTARLLRLCACADRDNLALMRIVWPEVVEAYIEWRDRSDD